MSSLMADKWCMFCTSSPRRQRAVLLSPQARGNLKPEQVVVFGSPSAQLGHTLGVAKLPGAPASLMSSAEL